MKIGDAVRIRKGCKPEFNGRYPLQYYFISDVFYEYNVMYIRIEGSPFVNFLAKDFEVYKLTVFERFGRSNECGKLCKVFKNYIDHKFWNIVSPTGEDLGIMYGSYTVVILYAIQNPEFWISTYRCGKLYPV